MKSVMSYLLIYTLLATQSWAQSGAQLESKQVKIEQHLVRSAQTLFNSLSAQKRGELFNEMAQKVSQASALLDYLDQQVGQGKISSSQAKEVFLTRIADHWQAQLKNSQLNPKDQEILKDYYVKKLQTSSFDEIYDEFIKADEKLKTSGLTLAFGAAVLVGSIVAVAVIYIVVMSITYLVKYLLDCEDVKDKSYFEYVFKFWKH